MTHARVIRAQSPKQQRGGHRHRRKMLQRRWPQKKRDRTMKNSAKKCCPVLRGVKVGWYFPFGFSAASPGNKHTSIFKNQTTVLPTRYRAVAARASHLTTERCDLAQCTQRTDQEQQSGQARSTSQEISEKGPFGTSSRRRSIGLMHSQTRAAQVFRRTRSSITRGYTVSWVTLTQNLVHESCSRGVCGRRLRHSGSLCLR